MLKSTYLKVFYNTHNISLYLKVHIKQKQFISSSLINMKEKAQKHLLVLEVESSTPTPPIEAL